MSQTIEIAQNPSILCFTIVD